MIVILHSISDAGVETGEQVVSEDWRSIIVCFLHNRAGGISARDRKLIKVLRAV